MTDKELLEFAAKAAGIQIYWLNNKPYMRSTMEYPHDSWDPLKDDGDALRLAVKLELFHIYNMDQVSAMEYFDSTNTDTYAANRRAIVEAAAVIGKAMP